ncbi:MAG: hypothetical protein AAGF12_28235 [Myxococcota bacterium]
MGVEPESVVSQGIERRRNCPDCSGKVVCEYGQTLWLRQLQWSASFACGHCGARVEQDLAEEDVPPGIREAMIADRAFTVETSARGAALLKAIRAAFDVSISDAKKTATAIERGSWGATEPEAALVASHLDDAFVVPKTAGRP